MTISNEHIKSFADYFKRRQSDVLNLTRQLVESESPSGDEPGSNAVVSVLANEIKTISGVMVETIPVQGYGQHLRATAFGDPGDSGSIVLLGHTDTVHPRGSLERRPWRQDGSKVFGPGIFDMKANCALAVEIVRAFAVLGIKPAGRVVLLLTCDEETGSPTGRTIVEAAAKNARAVLVLEPPASGGRVKTGRKGTGMYFVEARGRAAHAGLEPEKGASAILEIARQTEKLHSYNNSNGGISVNVGIVHGGTLSNVVPAEASAEIDVRFNSEEEAKLIDTNIRNLRSVDERVQLIIRGGINRPALERSDKVQHLYETAKGVAQQLGFELGEAQVGGASDGNFAAAAGAAVLDGLGIDGDGAHAEHEHINSDDIARRGALIAGLISSL